MNTRILKKNISMGLFFLMLAGTLMACDRNLLFYKGNISNERGRVKLVANGSHRGILDTRDLELDYRYVRSPDGRIQFSGKVELAQRLKNFEIVDNLSIRLHFLDHAGAIIKSHVIFRSGYRVPTDYLNSAIALNMAFPLDAESITFSYSGKVSGSSGGVGSSSGGEGVSWEFWQMP